MEHVLLQEIKKQEPYFEEEKRKIRLQLTPDETSQEFPAFLIQLKIDNYFNTRVVTMYNWMTY